jgi:2,5-diketo-D-gluconate reductase B
VTTYFTSRDPGVDVLHHPTYRLGFGTYSLTGERGIDAIRTALEAGYRHVDTARLYGNQREVGEAIARADVPREELFVATKIGHFEEPEKTTEYVDSGVRDSLDRLGLDRVDLLYHHWPRRPSEIETVLPAFNTLVAEGLVDRVGVSNYTRDDLDRADDLLDVPLFANQIEMHPLLPQRALRRAVRERDATVVAYSPIAQGAVFDEAEITAVAEKHGVDEASVSLAWLLSKEGVAAIPRSQSPAHIRSNYAARQVDLDETDIERIDGIDRRHRCEDPAWMTWD